MDAYTKHVNKDMRKQLIYSWGEIVTAANWRSCCIKTTKLPHILWHFSYRCMIYVCSILFAVSTGQQEGLLQIPE